MSRISIVLKKDVDERELKGSVFITGFAGFGLVGYLTSRHIAYSLKMERIGFVRTRYIPETTFYTKNSGLVLPFEIYYRKIDSKKLVVLVNHGFPHSRERTDYAEVVVNWLKKIGVAEVILVGGLDPSVKEDPNERYRWIPLGGTKRFLDAPILEERHVVGPLALTMMFAEIEGIPGVVILPYAEPYRADPRATAIAVDIISKLIGINIDVSELYREAKIIEELEVKEKELVKKVYNSETGEKQHPMYM